MSLSPIALVLWVWSGSDAPWPEAPQQWVSCDGLDASSIEGRVIFGRGPAPRIDEIAGVLTEYEWLAPYCVGGPWDEPVPVDAATCEDRSTVARLMSVRGDARSWHGMAESIEPEDAALFEAVGSSLRDEEVRAELVERLRGDCSARSALHAGPVHDATVTSFIVEDASARERALVWLCNRGCDEVGAAVR